MDSLTAHYLARELDTAWRGRRVSAFALDANGPAVVLGGIGAPTVRFDLSRPDCRAVEATANEDRGVLDGYSIVGVAAPVDDRRLVIRLEKPGKFRGSPTRGATLTISFVPNARGAALASDEGHRFGQVGAAPREPAEPRPLLTRDVIDVAVATADAGLLLGGRWMSPAVARWLLADPASLAARYETIAALGPPAPAWCHGRLAPFAISDDAEPAGSLVEPRQASSGAAARPDDRRARAIARMRRELARAMEAPTLRAAADLLTAMAPDDAVPGSLTLPTGETIALDARPGDTPAVVAGRLYTRARAMDRARASLPARIAALEAQPEDAGTRTPAPDDTPTPEAPRLPYRRYTSSGGLEIRVGRSAVDNDALTFHASAPNDVWLHAQGTPGSHVVLRWSRDDAPPARDLEEAALLAAWHSSARGSTVVPVNWTRRRYVRKPRGASAGTVMVSRAETVFARPTAAAVRAIRDRVR